MEEPSYLRLGSVISVLTWISKHITWILLRYPSNNHTSCLLMVHYVLVPHIIIVFIFLPYNCCPEKWRFPALKSLLPPQFTTYRYRTGFIVKRKQVRITNYLGLPINLSFFLPIFKVVYFAKKYTFKKIN